MYIPIGPSKKQLYKIIVALLLLCYLIFLGMYKPKAETLNLEPNTNYCPNGSYFREVHNDKWYYGCTFGNYSYAKSYVSYLNIDNGYYDISGYIYFYTDTIESINMNANGTSCFITSDTKSGPQTFLSYYCFNVDVKNTELVLGVESYQTQYQNDTNRIGFGRDFTLNPHFDKSQTQAVTNIQNNTNDIKNNLNDSSIDNSSANDLTSNSAFQDSNGLDAIIKAPLNFIQSLTSSTCSSISLTIPYIDAQVNLPCMSTIYSKALGQQLVNLIALVINGVVLYRYCLKILQLVHNAKNPNKDELEVLDL